MLEKTFQPQNVEVDLYKEWEESGLFAPKNEDKTNPFCIMMPPPNVTGSLHMGHALNTTLQDILTRYHRMKGDTALWLPGTDHASIAVHMVLEKQLAEQGTTRQRLGRQAFLEKAWEWKEHSGSTITGQIRRLGATPDWARERFTMDDGLSKAVLHAFVALYKEGLIYRAKRLVNWDPERKSVISDLEVEQKEVKGHMWHIRYPVEGETERFITVATTRPETMLGDTAVAVHPDDARYKDLVGKSAVLPISGRMIPIIADEYADPEQGSGAVKITPAHDFNDFEVGQRNDLPMINVFDESACINENAPEAYRGLDRFEARKKVLKELEDLELLVEVEDIRHAVPYGQRSGVVVEPFLTDQWYVDAKTMAKPALEAVKTGKTEFVPKQWENTYFAWMENIQPWCISRQLWWGHQIPAWYGPDETVYVAESEADAYTQAKEDHGENVILTRDPDVLDTWFSSGLWPFSTLGWPEKTPDLEKFYPGSVLITGFDIIFFWVARMMMMGLHFMDEVPFRKIYMHAMVRDAKGQKMSKSKGNVIDPLDLIEAYGADALRFTMAAMAAQGRDIKLSEERIEGYRNFGTKLWNACRYAEMNGCAPQAAFDPALVAFTPNQWIISEVRRTCIKIEDALHNYKFNEAAQALYQFVWGTFCDWFLEFTKPVLQEEGHEAAAEVRATTAWVIEQILIQMNPFMPYITETLYKDFLGKSDLLLGAPWPTYEDKLEDESSTQEMEWLINVISEIRSVRADMNVPAGVKLALLVKGADESAKSNFARYEDIISRMARLESIGYTDQAPAGAIQAVVGDMTLILPVADIIDLDSERARLQKQIDKLASDVEKIEKKLANDQFVSNAPEEVVEEQKSRKAEAEALIDKLQQALKHLQAA